LCRLCKPVNSICPRRAEALDNLQRIKLTSASVLALIDAAIYVAFVSSEIGGNVLAYDPNLVFGQVISVCVTASLGVCGLGIALFGCRNCVLRVWG
jgi:hypothetical protein